MLVGIGIHIRDAFRRGLRIDSPKGERTTSIDQPGQQQARAQPMVLVDLAAQRRQKQKLASAVARRGNTGREQRRAKLHAGVMDVHLPQAGKQALPLGVHQARPRRNRNLAAHRRNPAVAHQHRGVLKSRAAGAIDQPRTDDGERALRLHGNLPLQVPQVQHLLAHTAADQRAGRFGVFVQDHLLRQASGKRHQRDQPVGVVHPHHLAAEHQVGDRIAAQPHHAALHQEGFVAHQLDLNRRSLRAGAQHRQPRRLSVAQPVAHHHHLQGGGHIGKAGKGHGRLGCGSRQAAFVNGRHGSGHLRRIQSCCRRTYHGLLLQMQRRSARAKTKAGRDGTVGTAIVRRHYGTQHLPALGKLVHRVLLRSDRVQQQVNEVDAMLGLKPSRRGLRLRAPPTKNKRAQQNSAETSRRHPAIVAVPA